MVGGSVVRDGFGFDTTTGQPIAGQATIIPANRLNTIGVNYAALYPAPNLPGTANNYTLNAPGHEQTDQMDSRVDENVTSKIQLFERFSLIEDTRFQAPVFSGIADGGSYTTGTKGTHLQVLRDLNQIPTPQPTFDASLQPYPQYGTFASIENRGNSTYHAFQLKAEKRTSNGLYFLSAFTFGKAIDDQPEICCNSPWPQNSYDIAAEKGLSDFDNRERWVTSVDYELPVRKGRQFLNHGGVLDGILGGWHLGGIVTFRSGFPFSPQIGFDPSNTGSPGLERSNQIGSGSLPDPSPSLWFNINDFPVPNCPQGCFGDAGKNVLEGPGEKTADLSPRKLFNFSERVNLECRAEFFNAFNHAVFSQPDPFITDGPGAAGVITSTVIPQRQIQFALKLHF
jgi:hypothetical protein